ncbi:MAG: class I SAM-dependent methyltransferase [Thiohalomonadaceae bacterium]
MSDETDALRRKWDERYRGLAVDETRAARVLTENLHLLPAQGRALDLACGLGAHACVLARAGLQVDAWDLSPVAIETLQAHATRHRLTLRAEVRDAIALPPPPAGYDVIVAVHFLERGLAPALMAALRPGGLLFYQTFAGVGPGPSNPAFRLGRGELRRLFADLTPVVYREEHDIGDGARGLRGEAMLIAQRT